MEEKLVTIVVLPLGKAHILKMQLEAGGIECDLENINLIEGSASSTVRVKIMETDVEKAVPIMENLLGVKPFRAKKQEKKERHILVPIDFSPHSEKATKMALTIARHLQIKLVFIHCYINPIIHSIPYSDIYAYDPNLLTKLEFVEENANKKFQDFVQKMSAEIGEEKWKSVSPEYIIKSGYPENDIVAFANSNGSRLIVMGSGGGQDAYALVGGVAADVMYNSRVPVLVVPEETPERLLTGFSSILYATNFDENDFAALDKLMSLLRPFKIKVVCAHVGQPKSSGWDLAQMEGMKGILARKYKNIDFECHIIVGKEIPEALEAFIQKQNLDILSLTTHKRNMIARLFNPSLARKMVFHTKTPLLVFHA